MRSALDRSPLTQLTLSRLREYVREPEAVFWTFFFPIIMAFGLGIAFRNKGPEQVFIGVLEGPRAQEIARALSVRKNITAQVLSSDSAAHALRRGAVALLVTDAGSGLTYRYDPTRPESQAARLQADDALQRAAGRSDPVAVREEHVTETGSRYIDFLVPGLIGLNLLGTGMWGVGFTIVTMRKQKLLKRMLATPMRKSDFLLSFLLARLGFLFLELVAILAFAHYAFDVQVRGSFGAIVLLGLLGSLSFTGLGLLTASRAKTTEALSGLMNLIMMPMWILSGVFFSSDHFPDAIQPFIQALPLTAMNNALRSVMIDGASIAANLTSVAIVAAWGFLSFTVALAIFRWR